ncbi:MAG: NAD(+)/NADH kinase [Bacilli bacterium]|nr:NAD(+)/NADH kinase [Bacilli bacterium]
MKEIRKVRLFPNHNEKSFKVAHELKQKLKSRRYDLSDDSCDLAIAIGGDGSFLRMVKQCQFHEDIYYVGVNTGTLGFAQEIYPKEVECFLDRLEQKEYQEEKIGIATTKVTTDSGSDVFSSLNEYVIRDQNLKTTRFRIDINENLLEKFIGDGVSIATSFGSTAYNRNLGGCMVYNELHTLQITPIAPITDYNQGYQALGNSILIPEERVIHITPDQACRNFIITTDGENKFYSNVSSLTTSVDRKIKLLRMREYDYTRKIHEKFL